MKLKLMKLGTVRLAVLSWDDYQYLVVPISDSRERQDRWELKDGRTVFQVWSARTMWKRTLKDGHYYSVRPDKVRRQLLIWLANHWLGGDAPDGPNGSPEYFKEEMWKWNFLETKEPLI